MPDVRQCWKKFLCPCLSSTEGSTLASRHTHISSQYTSNIAPVCCYNSPQTITKVDHTSPASCEKEDGWEITGRERLHSNQSLSNNSDSGFQNTKHVDDDDEDVMALGDLGSGQFSGEESKSEYMCDDTHL